MKYNAVHHRELWSESLDFVCKGEKQSTARSVTIGNVYQIINTCRQQKCFIYQPIATAILDTVEYLTFILIDVVTMLTVSTLNRLGILLIYAVQK